MAIFLCANTSYFRQHFFLLKNCFFENFINIAKGGEDVHVHSPPFYEVLSEERIFYNSRELMKWVGKFQLGMFLIGFSWGEFSREEFDGWGFSGWGF